MIDAISITNFRGIKETKIEGLGRINLFIGKNNSGKSSILEALCFAKVPFKPVDEIGRTVMKQLLNRRVQRMKVSLEEFVYNYDMTNKISLVFTFGTEEIPLQITCNERWIDYVVKHPDAKKAAILSIRNWPESDDSEVKSMMGEGVSDKAKNVVDFMKTRAGSYLGLPGVKRVFEKFLGDNLQNLLYLSNIELIDDNFTNSLAQFERDFWDRLLEGRTDKELTSILNNIYETGIEHFTFTPYHIDKQRRREQDRFKLFSVLPELALHIDDYGDGFRYAFSILAAAKLFTNRALLIEEIESHQHPGSLRKLIDTIIEIAFENELQLFITTHNDLVSVFLVSFQT